MIFKKNKKKETYQLTVEPTIADANYQIQNRLWSASFLTQ